MLILGARGEILLDKIFQLLAFPSEIWILSLRIKKRLISQCSLTACSYLICIFSFRTKKSDPMKNWGIADFFPRDNTLSLGIILKLVEAFYPISTESQIREFKPQNSQTINSFKVFSMRLILILFDLFPGFCWCWPYLYCPRWWPLATGGHWELQMWSVWIGICFCVNYTVYFRHLKKRM